MSRKDKKESEEVINSEVNWTQQETSEGGPGLLHHQFVVMEELVEKLKFLNYELEYCRKLNHSPINRHYFALATNPGEQFNSFTSLAAWLIRVCGIKMDQPVESDDPNSVIATILKHSKSLNLKPDFPPSKLKTGCGPHCIWTLNGLVDEALKAKKFSWRLPIYSLLGEDEGVHEEDEEHVQNLESLTEDGKNRKINEVKEMLDDSEDEEFILNLDDLNRRHSSSQFDGKGDCKPDKVLESSTDRKDWQLEVERVLPELQHTVRCDNKDWRVHLEQMLHIETLIESSSSLTSGKLNRIRKEITVDVEKINSREKYLNQQMSQLLDALWKAKHDQETVKKNHRSLNSVVTERTRYLAELSEALDQIKMEMKNTGVGMSDAAPISKIKQGINQLTDENNQMDIRIGVLQHMILHYPATKNGGLLKSDDEDEGNDSGINDEAI